MNRNKFAGADDIYLTKTKIAVRRVSTTQDRFGNFKMYDNTKYYSKNKKNLNLARKIYGNLRYGR